MGETMPKFLEDKLKKEYPNNPHAVYGTLNAIGAMKGNKETKKGAAMERKHERDSVGAKLEHDGKQHAKLPHHSEAAATPHRPAHVHHAEYYDGHKDGFGRQDRNRVMYRDSVPDGKRAE